MKQTVDLCALCAVDLGRAYTLIGAAGGAVHKVTCARCGMRAYGVTYDLTPRQSRRHDGEAEP